MFLYLYILYLCISLLENDCLVLEHVAIIKTNDCLVLGHVAIIKTSILFIINICGAGCIILNILGRFNFLFMKISYNSFHLKFIPTVA